MTETKVRSLKDLSWNVPESEYRASEAISYSMLSAYAREGRKAILLLKEKKDSDSLRFGSLLDCLITEPDTLHDRFVFAEFPQVSDTIIRIVKSLFDAFGQEHRSIHNIPYEHILYHVEYHNYYSNWKPETRVNDIKKKGEQYYNLLAIVNNRVLMSNEDLEIAIKCKQELGSNIRTAWLFENDPLGNSESFNQLKFILDDERYGSIRCMFDQIIVYHDQKLIIPIDLKTTSKDESDFNSSFITWRYDLQATMYSYILRKICETDEYYKDFTIAPFHFAVISRDNCSPVVWKYEDNLIPGDRINRTGYIYKGWEQLITEFRHFINSEDYRYSYEVQIGDTILSDLTPIEPRIEISEFKKEDVENVDIDV